MKRHSSVAWISLQRQPSKDINTNKRVDDKVFLLAQFTIIVFYILVVYAFFLFVCVVVALVVARDVFTSLHIKIIITTTTSMHFFFIAPYIAPPLFVLLFRLPVLLISSNFFVSSFFFSERPPRWPSGWGVRLEIGKSRVQIRFAPGFFRDGVIPLT